MQHADPRNHCADFSGWAGGPKGAQPGWWLFINGNGGGKGMGGAMPQVWKWTASCDAGGDYSSPYACSKMHRNG